jgi:queuine tRNA-ribosyltransferase
MNTIQIFKKEGVRVWEYQTQHGENRYTGFYACGHQGIVKATSPKDLKEMGIKIILANAYHCTETGRCPHKGDGGIHRFAGWDGAVLTDSGGYQIFSLGVLREIREDGVLFQSHMTGRDIS